MPTGYLMIDIEGTSLTAADRALLAHPKVCGLILFTRNYVDRAQLRALTAEVHALRSPSLLIAVDQEGGRVQRFRDEFAELPAMGIVGELHDAEPQQARPAAVELGWLMAAELRSVGVDFSFAPVLDLANPRSRVINDRAFHRDPEVVAHLAGGFVAGMHAAGMPAVGKHFPGHGTVEADSHVEVPVDERTGEVIEQRDLVPFRRLAERLEGMMPAHVCYRAVDSQPAGFSRYWLGEVLRRRLRFDGAIFSDDLNMAGAHVAGDVVARGAAALEAGCDILLHCNDRAGVEQLVAQLDWDPAPVARVRKIRMHGRAFDGGDLAANPRWSAARSLVAGLSRERELDLGDDTVA